MQKHRLLTMALHQILSRGFLISQIRTMVVCVQGLTRGGQVSVAGIGRKLPGNALAKHKIKRVDRFCGNDLISLRPLTRCMLLALSRGGNRLFISVDWTKIDNYQVLVFAVTTGYGRSVPVYWEVIDPKCERMKAVEVAAVARFHALVPDSIQVTLLADRGFDEVVFIAAVAQHFDYVIRVAKGNAISEAERTTPDPTFRLLSEKLTVRDRVVDFGTVLFTQSRRFETRIIGKHNSGHVDPWFLATNRSAAADEVVRIYCRRFDIEHAFKDWKDVHNGWKLGAVLSKSTERLTRLLIIPALAFLAMVLLGLFAESRNLHRRYQSNSTKSKRCLSVWRVGTLLFREKNLPRITADVLLAFLDILPLQLEVA